MGKMKSLQNYNSDFMPVGGEVTEGIDPFTPACAREYTPCPARQARLPAGNIQTEVMTNRQL